jgi:hypothetical protein
VWSRRGPRGWDSEQRGVANCITAETDWDSKAEVHGPKIITLTDIYVAFEQFKNGHYF